MEQRNNKQERLTENTKANDIFCIIIIIQLFKASIMLVYFSLIRSEEFNKII